MLYTRRTTFFLVFVPCGIKFESYSNQKRKLVCLNHVTCFVSCSSAIHVPRSYAFVVMALSPV